MSDIKSVLCLLCQHLNLSINIMMKPEYFRLAKFNTMAENVVDAFWKALNILGYHAVKEKQIETDFKQYDTLRTTKLYFAYLQYPAIEFYALSEKSKNNRPLLLAFAWLLGTQDILNIIIRINLSNSVLGRECSQLNSVEKKETQYNVPETFNAQINNILYLNGKKAKLVNRIHAASVNVSGLPHLSVSEAALIKRVSTTNKNALSNEDKIYIKELSTIASLLDVHMKWSKKKHVFFEWMVTVVQEHNISEHQLEDIDWNEVSKIISLLHCMTREKFEILSSQKETINCQDYEPKCISRLLRIQGGTGKNGVLGVPGPPGSLGRRPSSIPTRGSNPMGKFPPGSRSSISGPDVGRGLFVLSVSSMEPERDLTFACNGLETNDFDNCSSSLISSISVLMDLQIVQSPADKLADSYPLLRYHEDVRRALTLYAKVFAMGGEWHCSNGVLQDHRYAAINNM
ncbi:hypothetical protein WN51_09605 [Melipona quadrifasciata]|uniref:Tubulin epsilon and delta complex protein 1 domain-containing protein n=1 Tax=Melipona quadrifasciata TaxID=166423 RepID=A0A0M9A7U4_9HYME|nr:hypothetical protein WN51_09605 [Melipona quadrifasciata]